MKQVVFFTIMSTILLCASCKKEMPILPRAQSVTLLCNLKDFPFNSGINADSTDTVFKIDEKMNVWSAGEKMKTDNAVFQCVAGANQTGKFLGEIHTTEAAGLYKFYTIYPYNGTTGEDKTYISISVSKEQVQRDNRIDLVEKGFFVGRGEDNDLASEIDVAMKYQQAILCFSVNAEGTIFEEKKIASIQLQSDKEFIGNYVYDIVQDKSIVEHRGKKASLIFVDQPMMSESINGWLAVCPSDLRESENKLTIKAVDGTKAVISDFLPDSAYESQRFYTVEINLAELVANGKAEIEEAMIDLSEKGTANCYIVTHAYKYRFTPTKGNSKDLPEDLQTVDWLWATDSDLISAIEFKKDYVYFKATDKKGNAVLAGFNSAGNLVWSWHIWFTDDPTIDLHTVEPGFKIMDRNLGATSTEPDDVNSYGLYYQWGRKDPFIGALDAGSLTEGGRESEAFKTATAHTVFNPKYEDRKFTTIENNDPLIAYKASVEYAIANPTTFIVFKEDVNESKDSWFNSKAYDHDFLWGKKDNNTTEKSIYDPSPVGFKLAPISEITWKIFALSGEFTGSLGGYSYLSKGKKHHYPAPGFRKFKNGKLHSNGHNAFYWTAMPYRTSGRVFSINKSAEDPIKPFLRISRAEGLSIRCIKE